MINQHGEFIDITEEICPITFVKVKLLLERLEPGSVLVVRLNSGEPLQNVPKSAAELGHHIVSNQPETPGQADGVHLLRIQVGPARGGPKAP